MRHLLLLLLLTPFALQGTTITITGPEDANGAPCVAGAAHCIIGDIASYEVFSVQLTTPSSPGGKWTLTIKTNYGAILPGSPDLIPNYPYEGVSFGISDLLINWNNTDYGLVLTAHDGYTAGDLYSAPTFQTSQDVMGGKVVDIPRPGLPVLLGGMGSLLGVGTLGVSANAGSNGISSALYTITDSFSAPSNFLSTGTFTIYDSSYVCANGYLTGTGTLVGSGAAPEPVTTGLVGASLIGFGYLRLRKKKQS